MSPPKNLSFTPTQNRVEQCWDVDHNLPLTEIHQVGRGGFGDFKDFLGKGLIFPLYLFLLDSNLVVLPLRFTNIRLFSSLTRLARALHAWILKF